MLITHRHLLAAVCIASILQVANAQNQRPDALVITHTDAKYVLQVPVSKLELTIPDTGLKNEALNIGGATSNPRYFSFSDTKRGLFISGWFEPASRFKGLQSFWESETASWKNNDLPEPQNVSTGNIGNWQAISYELKLPQSSNRHVRAHLVQAETWIDIHISVTSSSLETINAQSPEAILKSMSVSEKVGL